MVDDAKEIVGKLTAREVALLEGVALQIHSRSDELEKRADKAAEAKSPNVITLLFAAVELAKAGDMVRALLHKEQCDG